MLVYTPEGKLLEEQTIGGTCGSGDGEFQFVTDAAQDAAGNYYVTQYGEYDRIQKFSPDRKFLLSWGEHGHELGQFLRPQKIVIDQQGLVWVTDACNHRVQVFDASGSEAKLVKSWGEQGHEPGRAQLSVRHSARRRGAGRAGGRASCICASSATTACRNSRSTASSSGPLARMAGARASSISPGASPGIRRGGCLCSTRYNHRVQRFRL